MKKNPFGQFIEKMEIMSFDGEALVEVSEPVIREVSLEIVLDGKHYVTLACTGDNLQELAVGLLRSEDIVRSREDIESVEIDPDSLRAEVRLKKGLRPASGPRSIGSSGGRGFSGDIIPPSLPESGLRLSPPRVLILVRRLLQSTKLHDLTRGTHCSALADARDIIASREDIGRHNTLDMLGGYALLNGIDCSDKVLLTTGRISSEMVSKAARIGVPFVISHSAATSRAVRLASELGMTVVGYVRGGKFRVYAGSGVSLHKERK